MHAGFDRLHGADQMAVEKLKPGIDSFAADQVGFLGLLWGFRFWGFRGLGF